MHWRLGTTETFRHWRQLNYPAELLLFFIVLVRQLHNSAHSVSHLYLDIANMLPDFKLIHHAILSCIMFLLHKRLTVPCIQPNLPSHLSISSSMSKL